MKNASNKLNPSQIDGLRLKPVEFGSIGQYGQGKNYHGELRISGKKKSSLDRAVSKRGGMQGFTCS